MEKSLFYFKMLCALQIIITFLPGQITDIAGKETFQTDAIKNDSCLLRGFSVAVKAIMCSACEDGVYRSATQNNRAPPISKEKDLVTSISRKMIFLV